MKSIQLKLFAGVIVGVLYFFSFNWLYKFYRIGIDGKWNLSINDHYLLSTLFILLLYSMFHLIIFRKLDKKKNSEERYSWYITSWIFATIIGYFVFFGLSFPQPAILIINGKIDPFIYFVILHIILDPFVESRAYIRAHPPEYDSSSSSYSSSSPIDEYEDDYQVKRRSERELQYYADEADAARRMGHSRSLVDSYDDAADRSFGERSNADWQNDYDED